MKVRPLGRAALVVLPSFLLAGCDQAVKWAAAERLRDAAPQSYLGDVVRFEYAENPGAFLSLGADLPAETRALLWITGLGIMLVAVLAFAALNPRLRPLTTVGLILLLGGGFGNWIDRVSHGNVVVDFVSLGIGQLRTGVFNVADLFVEGGAIVLVLSQIRGQRAKPTRTPGPST